MLCVEAHVNLNEAFSSGLIRNPQLLWGPLCLWVAYTIFSRSSLRHPLQMTACMAHLYGDSLYYATSLFDHYANDRPYSRPEPYYFWVYYFLMNFIWIVIPLCKSFAVSVAATAADRFSRLLCAEREGGVERFPETDGPVEGA